MLDAEHYIFAPLFINCISVSNNFGFVEVVILLNYI